MLPKNRKPSDSKIRPELETTKKLKAKNNKKTHQSRSIVNLAADKRKVRIEHRRIRNVNKRSRISFSSESTVSSARCSTNDSFVELDDKIPKVSSFTKQLNKYSLKKKTGKKWPIRRSLFPFVPPYIAFKPHDVENVTTNDQVSRSLKWKLTSKTPLLIRKILMNTGFTLVTKSDFWMGTWGKHQKSIVFRSLKKSQKINHFPGTFHMGRKDRLWKNLQKLILKYGQKEFGFTPRTFILPTDLNALEQAMKKNTNDRWILKPPAASRGQGIKVVYKWQQIQKCRSLIVQKYITNPYLINGCKFDIRLYALVTSFDPLRIYLYEDGLVRFALTKYCNDVSTLDDVNMHLTNYSINKLSCRYKDNDDANSCKGHKWTLIKLFEHLEKNHMNTQKIKESLKEIVIKSLSCAEVYTTTLFQENVTSRYNCYELFGVDILMDDKQRLWLLEINISPSLHSKSQVDVHVKGPMIQNLFNLVQFNLPAKLKSMTGAPLCFDGELYNVAITSREKQKQTRFIMTESRDDYLNNILRELSCDDVRVLIQAEDEFTVKGKFERIFPTEKTYKYLRFMQPRYYNRLFDAWENKYAMNRHLGVQLLQSLCEKKVHYISSMYPSDTQPDKEKPSKSRTEKSLLPDWANPETFKFSLN